NGDGTALLSGTPSAADLGAHDVILEATDGVITTNIQQVFTINVYDQNTAPVITSAPVLNAIEDQLYQYLFVSADANFWATLSVSAPTLPGWLVLTDNGDGSALLEGTPRNQNVGANPVVLEVTDGVAAPVQQSFTINVQNTNDAPLFTSIPVTQVDEGFLYTYNVTTSDVDNGDVLVISGSNIPVWMTLVDNGDGTAVLSGTPDGTALGVYNITLFVDDGNVAQPTEQPFSVTVDPYNYDPMFTSIPVTTATEDIPYIYNITTSDQNTWAVLTVNAPTLPSWLTLTDHGNGTATLQGTPDDSDTGLNNVTISLTDGQIAIPVTQTFVINVAAVNDQPFFTVFPSDITINEGALYQFDITTHDNDSALLSITAPVLPAWLTFTNNGNGTAHIEGTPDGNNIGANPVTLGVSDGIAPILEQSYTITVNQFNYSPSFVSSPVLTVLQDNLYIYNVVTTDFNTWATLTLTSPLLPAWLAFTDNGDGTGLLTGTPTNAEVGTHPVTLRVSDGVSIPINQQFNIQVVNTNDGPVVSTPIPDLTVAEDFVTPIEIDLNQHFFDMDGNPLSYSYTSNSDEINVSLSVNMLTITSVSDWYGTSSVTVTADDMLNRISVSDTFDVIVTPVNDALIFTTTNDTTAVVGTNYTYHAVVTDADPLDTITFGVTGTVPAWLTYTPNLDRTVDFAGIPASSDYGVYDFILTATDGTVNISQDIHINVYEDNATPQFTSAPVTQVDQDVVYTYNITATDANDWATLIISAPVLPAWLTFADNGNGTALLTGTPTNDEVGVHNVQLSLTDNITAPVLQNFTITVNNINDTPVVILALDDMAVDEDFTPFSIDLTLHFSDPDNDALVYSVVSTAGEVITQINTTNLLVSPVANWYGSTTITVTASDQITRNQVSDAFVLTINPINDLPVFTTTNDTLATVDENYTYQAIVSDLDSTDSISFSIIGSLPAWLTFTDNADRTADFSGTPVSLDYGMYDFTLRATDGTVNINQQIHINVWEDNYLPQFDSTPILTATEDELYHYDIAVSDANAWNTLNITTVALPGWLTLAYTAGEETAILSGTPTNDEVGDWNVTLQLDDGVIANPVEQQFTITVLNVNDAPYVFNPIDPIVLQEDFDDMYLIHWNEHFADDDINDNLTYEVIAPNPLFFDFKWDDSDLVIVARHDYSGTGTITITASDGNRITSGARSIRSEVSVDVPITITAVNDAPVIVTPIADFNMDENTIDTHIDVTTVFDDVDLPYGDVLTYSWSNPANISVSLNGTVLVLEPTLNWYGTETIQLTATDSENEQVTDEFIVTVNNVSDLPVIEPIADQLYINSMNGPFNYQVDFYAYPDIAFVLTGTPTGMTIDANGMITWFPQIDQMGVYSITVTGNNIAGSDQETFTLRAVNEVFGPQSMDAAPLAVDTINLRWTAPPTTAWITNYRIYISDSYNGVYSILETVNSDVFQYNYSVPDEGMTYFYKVSALLDAVVWQGETAFSSISSVYTLEAGEDEISNDDGSDEDAQPVVADTQLGVRFDLVHRSEFVVTKAAVFITDLSTDDLVVEFSDSGILPDNEVAGLTVTYPAASINLGWNFLAIPSAIQPSFFGDNFYIRILGSSDPWGIGLDTSTNGNTFRKVANVWNPLLTGEAMVRAIIKQLDAIISVDTVAHDFGLIYTKDHSAPYDIGVSNIGNKELLINSVNAPPGYEIRESGDTDWETVLSNLTIVPSGILTIQVRFAPTQSDFTYNGNLVFNSTDENNPVVSVALSGTTMESEPNAFTPNGDGKNDTFNFKVISDTNDNVKMTIFNLKGRKMKEITGRSNAPLVWNGEDDSGDECNSGPYLYVVEKAGDRYQRGKIYLVK
ncbi:MAG: tandem-95 repeat protein, partial [Candidatus Cloacimonetes bacterium]|nr:tandem-95 repeat protein [Candidatus Cloacimonadota bacterium]